MEYQPTLVTALNVDFSTSLWFDVYKDCSSVIESDECLLAFLVFTSVPPCAVSDYSEHLIQY